MANNSTHRATARISPHIIKTDFRDTDYDMIDAQQRKVHYYSAMPHLATAKCRQHVPALLSRREERQGRLTMTQNSLYGI